MIALFGKPSCEIALDTAWHLWSHQGAVVERSSTYQSLVCGLVLVRWPTVRNRAGTAH